MPQSDINSLSKYIRGNLDSVDPEIRDEIIHELREVQYLQTIHYCRARLKHAYRRINEVKSRIKADCIIEGDETLLSELNSYCLKLHGQLGAAIRGLSNLFCLPPGLFKVSYMTPCKLLPP